MDSELGISLIQSPQQWAELSLLCFWYNWSVCG